MEKLYTVSKNNTKMTVAQIMNSVLQNSDYIVTPIQKKKKKTKNDSSLLLSGVDSLSCRQSVAWDHHISPTWELVKNATSQPPSRLKNQNSCGRSPAICFNKVTVDSGASLVAQLVKNPPAM